MYDTLIRDSEKVVSEGLVDLETMVVAKKPLKLSFPEYFLGKKLAIFGSEIYISGVFSLIMDDKYFSVSNSPSMIKTDPSEYKVVKVNGISYYELSYEPGDAIIADKNMIKSADVASALYSLFVDQGKNPWFYRSNNSNIDDKLSLFVNCGEYAGMVIGDGIAPMAMIIAATQKSSVTKDTPFRLYLNNNTGDIVPAAHAGLNNIEFIASSTMSRITSPYYNDTIGAALLNPTNTIEGLELVYRE